MTPILSRCVIRALRSCIPFARYHEPWLALEERIHRSMGVGGSMGKWAPRAEDEVPISVLWSSDAAQYALPCCDEEVSSRAQYRMAA